MTATVNADAVLATGGASSSSAGGQGGDRTAVTTEVDTANGGKRIRTETINGITWTLGYDVHGRVTTWTALSGNLVATQTFDADGFGTMSGNYYRGDEVVVTVSQMASIKTELAALGASMDATPMFSVRDFRAGSGQSLEWDDVNIGFRGRGGAPILVDITNTNDAAGAWTGSAVESGDKRTVSVPGWLRHKNSVLIVDGDISTTGTASTKTIRVYHGGVNVYSHSVGTGAANNSQRFAVRISNRDSLSAQAISNTGAYDSVGLSTAATATGAVNTGNDTNVVIRYILGNAADSIIFNTCRVSLEN